VVGIALARPLVSIVCPSFDFADTVVGKTSLPVVCTVQNLPGSSQATGALTVATTGEFAVATNNCTAALLPTGLAPGLSCTIGLTFSPTVKGLRNGTIGVTSANGGAANQNVTGTGLGVIGPGDAG
jgi:hypothetical protein